MRVSFGHMLMVLTTLRMVAGPICLMLVFRSQRHAALEALYLDQPHLSEMCVMVINAYMYYG